MASHAHARAPLAAASASSAEVSSPENESSQVFQTKIILAEELQDALEAYRASRAFDPKEFIRRKGEMLNTYMKDNKLKACVVSVSGGIDSAVTLGLAKAASKMKGSPIEKVLGVAQPIHSSDWACRRARETCLALSTEMVVIDQTELHDTLKTQIDEIVGIDGGSFATGQLRSYQRTPVAYYVAQLLSQGNPGRATPARPCIVLGTGNMDEDGYLAYFCKAGDGVVDVQLIADIHKSEVYRVGLALGVPSTTLVAAPSADLWDGQEDEEELGFTYDFIELYAGWYLRLTEREREAFLHSLTNLAREQFTVWEKNCVAIHRRNRHKLDAPKNLNYLLL